MNMEYSILPAELRLMIMNNLTHVRDRVNLSSVGFLENELAKTAAAPMKITFHLRDENRESILSFMSNHVRNEYLVHIECSEISESDFVGLNRAKTLNFMNFDGIYTGDFTEPRHTPFFANWVSGIADNWIREEIEYAKTRPGSSNSISHALRYCKEVENLILPLENINLAGLSACKTLELRPIHIPTHPIFIDLSTIKSITGLKSLKISHGSILSSHASEIVDLPISLELPYCDIEGVAIDAEFEPLLVINYDDFHTIDISELDITEIPRLENIYSLNIRDTAIAELNPLHLPHLHTLNAAGTRLTSIPQIKTLVHLNISNTQIETVDISGLPKLKNLIASNLPLRDAGGFRHLHSLNISHTAVYDLTGLDNLWALDASYTPVKNVSNLSRLHTLNLSHTHVTNVEALGQVHTLNLSYTPVLDVSALTHVHNLDLSYTRVSDVSALGGTHYLNLCHTHVVNIKPLRNVHTLDLSKTDVTDVDCLTEVRVLSVNWTRVGSVANLYNLEKLFLKNTPMAKLDPKTLFRMIRCIKCVYNGEPASGRFQNSLPRRFDRLQLSRV
jgi:hypothetical protein